MRTNDLKKWGLTKEQSAKVMEQFGRDVTKLRKENQILSAQLDKEKVRAEAAEKKYKEEIREAGLKVMDSMILGLYDLLVKLREKDPSAAEC